MKKILKVIGVIVLLILAFVLIAGIFISKDYHLERSIVINAPKEKTWNHIGTLEGQARWSPFLDADPNIQTSVEGVDGTEGAVFKWKGNKDVGAGSETIVKLVKPESIELQLHFIEPFEGDATSSITQTDNGNGTTKVTWQYDSHYAYPTNVMLLFMDNMMKDLFDKGLNKLKVVAEAP